MFMLICIQHIVMNSPFTISATQKEFEEMYPGLSFRNGENTVVNADPKEETPPKPDPKKTRLKIKIHEFVTTKKP